MASPYYRCPNCHNVSRKNDNMFEMVEMSGSNTVFAVAGGAPCPDCGVSHSFDDIYLHPKYDVPIEDVYGGKAGVDLQLIHRAHAAGKIRLSEQELALLKTNPPAAASSSKATAGATASAQMSSEQEKVRLQPTLRSSSAKSTSSSTQKKEIGCGPGSIGILFLIAAAVSVYLEQQGAGCGYGTAAALAGLGLIGLIAFAKSADDESGIDYPTEHLS